MVIRQAFVKAKEINEVGQYGVLKEIQKCIFRHF
jgi:hypothetical protein